MRFGIVGTRDTTGVVTKPTPGAHGMQPAPVWLCVNSVAPPQHQYGVPHGTACFESVNVSTVRTVQTSSASFRKMPNFGPTHSSSTRILSRAFQRSTHAPLSQTKASSTTQRPALQSYAYGQTGVPRRVPSLFHTRNNRDKSNALTHMHTSRCRHPLHPPPLL